MNHQINASIQIIPKSVDHDTYALVDEAIGIIQRSGLRYQVTPLETIVEGPYDQVMETFRLAQEATLKAGADQLIVFIKLHLAGDRDVTFEEKTGKYEE